MESPPLSSLLKEVMSACGLRQTGLADVLQVTLDRVKSLTSGKAKKLTPDETRRLVQTLNLSAHWLATGEGAMFNPQGGEALSEKLLQMRLCTERVSAMGLESVQAQAARDIAYGVQISDSATVLDGISLLVPNADEQELLALFRAAPLAVKAAAIGALQGGASTKPATPKKPAQARVSIGTVHGQNITGDITNHGPLTFGVSPPKPKPKKSSP